MKIVERKISELIPADYNPRKLSDKQYKDLKISLKKFGFVDPVIVNIAPNRKNIIIGGHQRLKVWQDLGNETAPCYEISLNDKDERELNIRLNKNTGEFDFEMLSSYFNKMDLIDWGFEEYVFDTIEDVKNETEIDNTYTKKISSPIYEITGDKPLISELFDINKTSQLINKIEKSDIPIEIKEFLRYASYRHIVFNYSNIAEFYAHSSKDIQELFEESALIIIDFEKAIENGFVRLSEEIANQFIKGDEK